METMMKRLIQIALTAVLLPGAAVCALAITPATEHIKVESFDSEVDYYKEMKKCAQDGSEYALQIGAIYEQQRNMKIEDMDLEHKKTTYFSRYDTGEEILTAMKAERLKADYYVAGCVYEHLREQGYSEPVIAGILGNMMAECGGQTLSLQWNLYGGGGSYYGLCMWSLRYGPDVQGRNVTGQLSYLTGNINEIIEQFGGSYDYFCSLEDAGQAARYFANYYERGSGAGVRARNAYQAMAWIESYESEAS